VGLGSRGRSRGWSPGCHRVGVIYTGVGSSLDVAFNLWSMSVRVTLAWEVLSVHGSSAMPVLCLNQEAFKPETRFRISFPLQPVTPTKHRSEVECVSDIELVIVAWSLSFTVTEYAM
jgi:hypothetical protein